MNNTLIPMYNVDKLNTDDDELIAEIRQEIANALREVDNTRAYAEQMRWQMEHERNRANQLNNQLADLKFEIKSGYYAKCVEAYNRERRRNLKIENIVCTILLILVAIGMFYASNALGRMIGLMY